MNTLVLRWHWDPFSYSPVPLSPSLTCWERHPAAACERYWRLLSMLSITYQSFCWCIILHTAYVLVCALECMVKLNQKAGAFITDNLHIVSITPLHSKSLIMWCYTPRLDFRTTFAQIKWKGRSISPVLMFPSLQPLITAVARWSKHKAKGSKDKRECSM